MTSTSVMTRTDKRSLQVTAVVVLIAAALPLLVDSNGYAIRVMTLTLLFAALGQAWNLIGGLANQVSLGHAGFFGIGAYTSTILLNEFNVSPFLGMLVGAALAAVVAMVLSFPVFRLKGHYFALATLAFGEVMRIIAESWHGLTGGPVGISVPFRGQSSVLMLQFDSTLPYYYLMLLALVLTSGVFWYIKTGSMGYRLRALKEHQDAAEVIGVDTFRTKVQALMISAAITAVLGTLYAQFVFFFDPATAFGLVPISIRMALIAIIGGLGLMWGPIVGAAVVIPFEELTNSYLGAGQAGVSRFVFGVLLVVVILLNPRGLIALAKRLTPARWKETRR